MCSSDWDGDQCVDVSGNCATNADCTEPNMYCHISATFAYSETSCFKNYSGTCVAIGSKEEATIEGLGTVYKSSSSDMTWWSAKNWCAAQGKRLISADHLGCYRNTDGTRPHSGINRGYCCAQYQTRCGDTLSKQSAIMQGLRRKWSGIAWTDTSYNSCQAFGAYMYFGEVFYYYRSDDDYFNYALCEE